MTVPHTKATSQPHRSSRMPLKNGWCTLPSADFARCSTSADSSGSTLMNPSLAVRHLAKPGSMNPGKVALMPPADSA
jgi:hypothetical protein